MTELIVTLEDNTSAIIIRKAISLLKGVKSVVTKHTKDLTKAQEVQLNRIKELKALKKGWDGDSALPIYTKTIKNVEKIIKKSTEQELSSWTIFPEINGTLLIQKNDNSACASIGNDNYSIISDNITINNESFKISQVVYNLKKM